MIHCSPRDPERFYLRLMLCHRPGPISFEDLRMVDGRVYDSFHEAAMQSGYLENDREWVACLEEASVFRMPRQLRLLFATILLYSMPADARALWNTFYAELSRDYEFQCRDLLNKDDVVMFKTLKCIHDFLASGGKGLADFDDLPQLSQFPDLVLEALQDNNLIRRELEGYNRSDLEQMVETVDSLNSNQREIYDDIMSAIQANQLDNKLFFIDGPGGTGKSTLLNHILARVRLDGNIAIAVASSGIASLLLPGGRTAHSTFKIPIKVKDDSTCNISKQSKVSQFIRRASLIVWDEAPMTHRYAFEALDRTLRDVLNNRDEVFGGKVVVLSGDFRQILPVVKNATAAETVDASLRASPLWSSFKIQRLTINMRVQRAANEETAAELGEFSQCTAKKNSTIQWWQRMITSQVALFSLQQISLFRK
jgi:hypothetical protein